MDAKLDAELDAKNIPSYSAVPKCIKYKWKKTQFLRAIFSNAYTAYVLKFLLNWILLAQHCSVYRFLAPALTPTAWTPKLII